MVGDGIHDAPVLAMADAAMHAAGITLMRGDPARVANARLLRRWKAGAKIR